MSKKGGGDGFYTQQFRCAVCGKVRYRNKAWIYKRGTSPKTKFFCGYNCMSKFDKEVQEEKEAKEKAREEKKKAYDKARAAANKALRQRAKTTSEASR